MLYYFTVYAAVAVLLLTLILVAHWLGDLKALERKVDYLTPRMLIKTSVLWPVAVILFVAVFVSVSVQDFVEYLRRS